MENTQEKITFNGKSDGIAVEQLVRFGQYNMKVKHFHSQYEIFYIIAGTRQFFFNNRQYVAQSGDLILIDTNLIHMTKSVEPEVPGFNRVILYIDSWKMQEFDQKYPELQLVHFFHEHYGVFHLNEEQQNQFLSVYRDLRIAIASKKPGYKTGVDLSVLLWMYRLTAQLSSQFVTISPIADNAKCKTVYAVADYLSQNCEKNISLEDLADHFYLSKYYLCRIFKEITNYKITEYINIYRIRKSTKLLEETNLSISEISQQLGFESITYFERIFKKHMSVTPLHYRKTKDSVTLEQEELGILDDSGFLESDLIHNKVSNMNDDNGNCEEM